MRMMPSASLSLRHIAACAAPTERVFERVRDDIRFGGVAGDAAEGCVSIVAAAGGCVGGSASRGGAGLIGCGGSCGGVGCSSVIGGGGGGGRGAG
jgi:hypothetical protein